MPLVKLYANLRKIAEAKETRVSASTLGETLAALIRQFSSLENAILDGSKIRAHVVITINGINAQDLTAAIKDDDLVAIFPPIAGG